MSQKINKLLPIILLFSAIGLGWLSWREYSNILIIQIEIIDAQSKVDTLKATVKKVDDFVSYVKKNPEAAERIDIFLSDDSKKLNMMSFLTNSSGVLLKNVNFTESLEPQVISTDSSAKVVVGEKPSTQEINLSFNGTYPVLKNFLNFTEKSLKLMDITSIDFKPAAKEDFEAASYDFSISLRTYYINKGAEPTEETKKIIANRLTSLSFAGQKQFTDLVPPQSYNIDTTDTGDWGNKNIF